MLAAVLIATSGRRTRLLANRSLRSVYTMNAVDPAEVQVVVVDDNADRAELKHVAVEIEHLRRRIGLRAEDYPTTLIRNARTVGHSGTGAWNTGLDWLRSRSNPRAWIALLDDDDEFLPRHMANCLGAAGDGVVGIFERLEWVRTNGIEQRPFSVDDLTPQAFFVGNPGVQGSNLFLRLEALTAIGGFDESLPNTTDRDLMIRLLRHASRSKQIVCVLPTIGVRYYDHDEPRVNTDVRRKHQGLDLFYAKHAQDFSQADLDASLARSRTLFGYQRNQ